MAAGSHFGCPKNHFVSHFLPFQINTPIFIFVNFFTKYIYIYIYIYIYKDINSDTGTNIRMYTVVVGIYYH